MELHRVQICSLEHLLPICVAIVFLVFLLKIAKRTSKDIQDRIIHLFSMVVSSVLIVYHLTQIAFGDYNFTEDLPLFLCSFMALIIPLFTYYRKYWMFEILVFWIIAGTLQGVITPDIAKGFPSFDYFRYWFVHLGLLIIISYAIVIFKMKPSLKSMFKSYVVFQCYIVVMLLLNFVLGSNYGYLNRKPESASVLDVLGDWPIYVVKADVILFVAFFIIYICFYVSKKSASIK